MHVYKLLSASVCAQSVSVHDLGLLLSVSLGSMPTFILKTV